MSQISGHADNHKAEDFVIPSSRWGEQICADADAIGINLLDIERKIAPCKPRIIGVTKYYGLDAIINGYKAGLRDFAESRAVDAVKKLEMLPSEIRENSTFHFIGHLQTNKAEMVVKNFDYIQAIDSLKLARVVSDVACRLNKREKVLLQVNISEEEQKFGYEIEQLKIDFNEIQSLKGLVVEGLMCMAPFGASEESLKGIFSTLRELRDELENLFNVKLPELSMGMSDDYEVAIREGATMIRIGRKLFK